MVMKPKTKGSDEVRRPMKKKSIHSMATKTIAAQNRKGLEPTKQTILIVDDEPENIEILGANSSALNVKFFLP